MSEDVHKKLTDLREAYLKALPEKIMEIESTWDLVKGDWNQQNLLTLQRMAHNIHGTSASYGLLNVGQAAERLEHYIEILRGKKMNGSAIDISTIENLIFMLKEMCNTQDV